MTTIEDTLTYIDGSKANGRLVVGWKPFTVGNVNAAGGELEWQIVEGAVSISLYSNTGAQPTGSYYVVKYELENGAVYLEQWIVPDLPTVNLGQVRVAFPPSPSVMISPLQLTSLGAAPGMFLMWNGQRWVPGYPGTFSFVDPTLVKGDMIVRGDVAPATRLGVGADGLVLTANSSQPLGVSWTLVGGASSQSPWVVDIDGTGHKLKNTGNIGVGNDATGLAFAGYPQLIVGPSTVTGMAGLIMTCANVASGTGTMGGISGVNFALAGTDKRIGQVQFIASGASSNSGDIALETANVGTLGERMRITAAGNVGIGTASPIGSLTVKTGTDLDLSITTSPSVAGTIRFVASNDMGTLAAPLELYALSTYLMGGNVGIGTTGPASRLTVIPTTNPSTVATANQLAIGESGNNSAYRFSLGFGPISKWAGVLQVTDNSVGSDLLLNPNGGNVGIGTTGPQVPLHVVKFVSVGPSVPAAGTYGGPVIISNDSVNYGMYIGSLNSGSGYVQQQRGDSAVTYNLLLQPNGGNVGIGTASPGAPLHVFRSSGTPTAIIADNNAGGGQAFQFAYQGTGVIGGIYNYFSSNWCLGLRAWTNSAEVERITINGLTGNVGIGTTGPGYKLDVAGDVNCSGVFRRNGIACGTPSGFYNQTGARALNTAYQNTTGMPIFVNVITSVNASQYMQVLTDIANPPTTVVSVASNGAGVSATLTVSGWVMPGHYYKVFHSGGSLTSWIEWF